MKEVGVRDLTKKFLTSILFFIWLIFKEYFIILAKINKNVLLKLNTILVIESFRNSTLNACFYMIIHQKSSNTWLLMGRFLKNILILERLFFLILSILYTVRLLGGIAYTSFIAVSESFNTRTSHYNSNIPPLHNLY